MPWELRSHHGRADEAAKRGGIAHGWRYAALKRVAGRVASRVELMPSALEELFNRRFATNIRRFAPNKVTPPPNQDVPAVAPLPQGKQKSLF